MRYFASRRRAVMLAALAFTVIGASATASASEDAAWAALRIGGIALFRHANAPGGGDPAGFRLNDCTTQRNLDDAGRRQAKRIGEAFRARGVSVGQVLTSQWCRTRETAELAFPGRMRDEPAFNSFFEDRSKGPAQTAAAIGVLQNWHRSGALFVSTHQVNITGLTGIVPASGEGVVVILDGGALRVIGRIRP